MKALIDADIFQWEFGSATDDEYKPLSWPLIQARVQGRINGILERTGADEYQLYITSDDKSNFRYDVATIRPYKGNRKDIEKPHWYTHIRNFLVDQRGAIEVFDMEADDAISIAAYKNYYETLESTKSYIKPTPDVIICSRDKDLDMIPGWHYGWGAGNQKEKKVWWQNEADGLRCFYKQLLTGDAVDNIPGLYGVGKSSTHLKHVDTAESEQAMYDLVLTEYRKRFGSYAEQFLTENAHLLWMKKSENDVWVRPGFEPITKEDIEWRFKDEN